MAKRLKKGLDQIFGDIDDVINDISGKNDQTELPLEEIRPNPYQPRKTFDDDKINELAASIKEHGVFQPIIVRKSLSGYELIAGERRLRASKIAQKDTIPAIVVNFDDSQMMEISLLENIQREDLSPLEEAEAYDQLLHKLNYTQEELSKRIGKSRPYITNMLRLLKLPLGIKELVNSKKLSYGHARTLLALDDEDRMLELAKKTVKEDLSVRELEKIISNTKNKPLVKEKKIDKSLENVRQIIENKFGTKVDINAHKIVISYKDVKDLNRILEIMDCLEKE